MPYPMKWDSGETISGSDWNDARLHRAADYIVFKEGITYYAFGQNTGSADFSGSVASTVIQNALNTFGTTGGTLKFLSGSYTITASIALKTGSALIGSGIGSILKAGASSLDLLTASGSDGHQLLISNLMLDGDKATRTTCRAITFQYITGSKILNCWFKNWDDENIYAFHGSQNIIVGNHFEKSNEEGINIVQGQEYTVANNIFYSNNLSGIVLNGVSGSIVANNIFRENANYGISLYRAYDNTVSGNYIGLTEYHGILVRDSNWNTISTNTLFSNSQNADDTYNEIYLTGSTFNSVMGNIMRCIETNKAKYGIREAANCDYNLIIGNIVSGSVTDTISVQGSNSQSGSNVNIA